MNAHAAHNITPAMVPATVRCNVCGETTDTPVTAFGAAICTDPDCAETLADAGEYASAQSAAWPPIGRTTCPTCEGSGSGPSEWHYVRGHGIKNDCPNHLCDGLGHIPEGAAA